MAKSKTMERDDDQATMQMIMRRLDRLERQMNVLSELVRGHAEDADRLVQIVAENREALRQGYLRTQQAKLLNRKKMHRSLKHLQPR